MLRIISNRVFYLVVILLACSLFVSDQIAKIRVLDYLTDMQSEIFIPVGPFIDIILVWNNGISFGLFSEWVFSKFMPLFTIFILFCVFVFYLKQVRLHNNRSIFISFAFIFGGACGNLADRLYYGAVLDYIDVYYGRYHFPTFNLADIYIFCGAALFLILYKSGSEESTRSIQNNKVKGGGNE